MIEQNNTVQKTKKRKKWPIIILVAAVLLIAVLRMWILPYVKRHYKTVEINREAVISGESVDVGNRKAAAVYFTRVGNSDFDDDVSAVSGASLLLDETEELMGNSQVIAQMIQDATGSGLISINVKNAYPSSYSDTISAARDEMKREELPELIDMPESIDEYDTVILIYPLWWNTIPKPVETFLNQYDFSDKTVLPVVTHGGSGVGKSVRDIKAVCNGMVIEDPLAIYCDDIPYCREQVTEWLQTVLS